MKRRNDHTCFSNNPRLAYRNPWKSADSKEENTKKKSESK